MIYEIEKDRDSMPTIGFAVEPIRPSSKGQIQTMDFMTPLNQSIFYEILENLGSNYLPDDMSPSHIATMIGVVRRDGSATVYINEDVEIIMKMRAANSIKNGQGVTKSDIADHSTRQNLNRFRKCGFPH